MKVSVADFTYKQQKEAPKSDAQNGKAAQSNSKDKKKIIKKTQKLNKYDSVLFFLSSCFHPLMDKLYPSPLRREESRRA